MAKLLTSTSLTRKRLLTGLCAVVFLNFPAFAQGNPAVNGAEPIAEFVSQSMADTDSAACGVAVPDRASLSRDRLVLNGGPSALERIRMNQGGSGTVADAPAGSTPSILMRSLANRPIANAMAPASRTALKLGEVREQQRAVSCGDGGIQSFADAFGSGRSDLLDAMGTRPILVRRTAFDARWQRVSRAPSLSLMRTHLQRADVSDGMSHADIFARVNRWVNQNIAYQADDRNYGLRDYWAGAAETLERMSGDCEDYAILKMHMLRAAGIRADRIKLMLLRDLAGNKDHAFLVVSSPSGDIVLDNTTDRIYAARDAVAVRPVLSFSGDRRWVHAFRNQDGLEAGFEAIPASASAAL